MGKKGKTASVLVMVRVRPMLPHETEKGIEGVVSTEDGDNFAQVVTPHRTFGYDHVFGPDTPQDNICSSVSPHIVQHTKEGYNVCIFAYGQTGSGKTFTMIGNHSDLSGHQPGLVQRLSDDLFQMSRTHGTGHVFRFTVQFYEIYKEKVYDLNSKTLSECKIREHPVLGPMVQGLNVIEVNTTEGVMQTLSKGMGRRKTAETQHNSRSSRSHAVFTISIQHHILLPGTKGDVSEITNKVVLTDLAGAEKMKGTKGERFDEGVDINKSLSCLRNVIGWLADAAVSGKKVHINYRDSALTWLLKDALGGNSLTTMIACVSPCDNHLEESLNTLRYADHAKKIKNTVKVNEDTKTKTIRELREELEKLKEQLLTGGGSHQEGMMSPASFRRKRLPKEKPSNCQVSIDGGEPRTLYYGETSVTHGALEQNNFEQSPTPNNSDLVPSYSVFFAANSPLFTIYLPEAKENHCSITVRRSCASLQPNDNFVTVNDVAVIDDMLLQDGDEVKIGAHVIRWINETERAEMGTISASALTPAGSPRDGPLSSGTEDGELQPVAPVKRRGGVKFAEGFDTWTTELSAATFSPSDDNDSSSSSASEVMGYDEGELDGEGGDGFRRHSRLNDFGMEMSRRFFEAERDMMLDDVGHIPTGESAFFSSDNDEQEQEITTEDAEQQCDEDAVLAASEARVSSLEQEAETARKELQRHEEEKTATVKELEEKLEEKAAALKNAEQRCTELEQAARQEKQAAEKQMGQLEKERDDRDRAHAELVKQLKSNESSGQQSLAQLHATKEELQKRTTKVEGERDRLEQELEKVRQSHETELRSLKQDREKTESTLRGDLKSSQESAAALKVELQKTTDERHRVERAKEEELVDVMRQWERKHAALDSQLSQRDAECREKDEKLRNLSATHDELRRQHEQTVGELKGTVHDTQSSYDKKLLAAEATIRDLEFQLRAATSEQERTKVRLDAAEGEREKIRTELDGLREAKRSAEVENDRRVRSLEADLLEVRRQHEGEMRAKDDAHATVVRSLESKLEDEARKAAAERATQAQEMTATVDRHQHELSTTQRDFNREKADFTQKLGAEERAKEHLQQRCSALEADLSAERKRSDSTMTKLREVEVEYATAKTSYAAVEERLKAEHETANRVREMQAHELDRWQHEAHREQQRATEMRETCDRRIADSQRARDTLSTQLTTLKDQIQQLSLDWKDKELSYLTELEKLASNKRQLEKDKEEALETILKQKKKFQALREKVVDIKNQHERQTNDVAALRGIIGASSNRADLSVSPAGSPARRISPSA